MVSKKVSPISMPEHSPGIFLNPIMASIGLNCPVMKETVMPKNANLFGEVHRSVVRATLLPRSIAITLSLDSIKVVINLSFTAVLPIGLYSGCRLEINLRNAGSSPKENE